MQNATTLARWFRASAHKHPPGAYVHFAGAREGALPRFTWSLRPRATSRSGSSRSSRVGRVAGVRLAVGRVRTRTGSPRHPQRRPIAQPAAAPPEPRIDCELFPVRPRRPRSLLCRWRPLPRDDRGAQARARRANNSSSTAIFRQAPGRSDGRPVSPAGAIGHGCWRGGGDPVVLARVVRAWSISACAAGLPGDVVRQARASSPLRRGWMISST
jgi:hypothetical protein